jgi:hypothetical protein
VDRVCSECGHIRLELKKNRDQRFAKKQYDIDGLPWLALEVKRVENQSGIGAWWRQVTDAQKPGQVPVLLYRQNNRPWMVRTRIPIKISKRTAVRCTVTMSFEDWLIWLEQKLKFELT